MRGNEQSIAGPASLLSSTFTIPMRGNEDPISALVTALDRLLRFTIPMRGNEIKKRYRNRLPCEFTIPMRGNELLRDSARVRHAPLTFTIPMRGNEHNPSSTTVRVAPAGLRSP